MRVRLKPSNILRKSLLVFLGVVALMGITRCAEAQIAFTSGSIGNLDIYIMAPDGKDVERFTLHESSNSEPTWSPDGKQIAFVSDRNGFSFQIYVATIGGGRSIKLNQHLAHNGSPAWSPDGKQIAFASYRNKIFDVYVINVDGTDERNLTDSRSRDQYPTWSPDGQHIAYSSEWNGIYGIYVMNAKWWGCWYCRGLKCG